MRLLGRLDRYVLRELALPLATGTLVIAAIFVANDAIAIFKNFNLESVPMLAVFQMLAWRLPHWLGLTLPAGTAMAVALVVSRLARDSELTAVRSAGTPLRRVLLPVLLVGGALAVCNFYVLDVLVPYSAKKYRRLVGEVGILAASPRFQSNVYLQLSRYSCSFGTVQRSAEGAVLVTDALLIERPGQGEYIVYAADAGTYDGGVWHFRDPRGWWIRGDSVQYVSRGELVINEAVRIADLFVPPAPEEETVEALSAALANAQKTGASTRDLETAVHQRYAVPSSCLVFAIATFWLSVRLARLGAFVGLFAGFGALVLYFNAHVISAEVLGRAGWVPPWLAAWLPAMVFGALALGLGARAE